MNMKAITLCFCLFAFVLNSGLAQDAKPETPAAKVPAPVKHVNASEAEKVIKETKEVVVLDIRTADEFKRGHIKGAKNIDFYADDFKAQVDKLDKSKTYVLHCASGGRSTMCLPVLSELKFQSVYHLDGGFKAWEKAGKPVEK
jgi:rhodanese-related sulfurtransferase